MPEDATHLVVVNIDVENSGRRDNAGQLNLRATVFGVVDAALQPPRQDGGQRGVGGTGSASIGGDGVIVQGGTARDILVGSSKHPGRSQ